MIVWRLAWRSALRRRRLFVWNVGVPLLLLTPVALSDAAAPHRVAVFGVFLVFFGAFGSAIPAVRDARDGWLDEVFGAGYPSWRWVAERTLAETTLDVIQALPALLVLLWSAGGLGTIGTTLLGVTVALLFANLLGPVIGAAVRSLAEAALASAAVSLFLLHYAGFFRSPVTGWTSVVAAWNPYAPLRAALRAGVGEAPADPATWATGCVAALFVGLVILLSADSWTRRLRWPRNV